MTANPLPEPHGSSGAIAAGTLRVAIVDARRLVREGLAALIRDEEGFVVVGAFAAADRIGADVDVDVVLLGAGAGPPEKQVRTCVHFGDGPVADLVEALRDGRDPASVSSGSSESTESRSNGHGLTTREAEVLAAMAAGDSNAGIAQSLGIAGKTVETYKQRIFTKLGVRSAAEAVALTAGSRS